jgi:hypothetical protein
VNRPYRLLVTGSRTWRNITLIRNVLGSVHRAHPGAVLVSGRCPAGADAVAESCWAAFCGMTVDEAIAAGRIEPHPADWDRYGTRAGPIRNGEMIKAGADECVAFIRAESAGATGCADGAGMAGMPVRRFTAP